jgi:hypothetical protein
MTLIKENVFQAQKTEEERLLEESEIIKVRLNKEERKLLEEFKVIIAQPKDGTALKDALEIAHAFVATQGVNRTILSIILGNRKRAARLGIPLKEDGF